MDGATTNGFENFTRSTDGGATWSSQTIPCATISSVVLDGSRQGFGSACTGSTYAQESYDQAIHILPLDTTGNTVFFGGVGFYESTNGGGVWSEPFFNGQIHSDVHAIQSDPFNNNEVYVGTDGGLFRFDIPSSTFTALNSNIVAAQSYSGSLTPDDPHTVIIGFQDNGVTLLSGSQNWTEQDVGDGGSTIFDLNASGYAYHVASVKFGNTVSPAAPMLNYSTNAGATWTDASANLTTVMANSSDPGPVFLGPLAADYTKGHRLFAAGEFAYVSTNGTISNFARQETAVLGGGCGTTNCSVISLALAPSDVNVAYSLSWANGAPFKVSRTGQAALNSGASWEIGPPACRAT
jgi:hypothetical protein